MATRREQYRQETIEYIKKTARREMAHRGTAGLSLRGIARAMEMSAPALYHYFGSLDELITALIVDGYQALAEAVQAAGQSVESDRPREQIRQSLLAYREWAVQNPTDYQLIYGNPIPGYQAPAEVTRPLASRPFEWLGGLMVSAWQQGKFAQGWIERLIPADIHAYLERYVAQAGYEIPIELMYLLVSGWTRIHGMIILEIIGHSQPVIGHPEVFYRREIDRFLDDLGIED